MRSPYFIGKLKYNWMVLRDEQVSRGWPLFLIFSIGNEHIGPTTAPVGFDGAAWGRLILAPRRNRWIWYFLAGWFSSVAQSMRSWWGKSKNPSLRCVMENIGNNVFHSMMPFKLLFCFFVICWFRVLQRKSPWCENSLGEFSVNQHPEVPRKNSTCGPVNLEPCKLGQNWPPAGAL